MPQGIYTNINCKDGKNDYKNFKPQKHQTDTKDFFMKSPYKGLLLYHGLGSGKTCTSIMIADEMLKQKKVKKVYVLTPGSLRQGWIREYCMQCGFDKKYLENNYIFVTYNYSIGKRLPNFNNSLVIIDEVHNLINGVKNMSFHSLKIYNALKNSNCRILALSGTVIYNYIYEFALLANLLKPREQGGEFPDILQNSKLDTYSFMKWFDITENGVLTAKNPFLLKNRLEGIISYFPGAGKEFIPDVLEQPPIKIQMSDEQEINYWNRQHLESKLLNFKESKEQLSGDREKFKKLSIMAKKHILTRLASNFFYKGIFNENKDIDIDEAVLENASDEPEEPEEPEEGEELDEKKQEKLNQNNLDLAMGLKIKKDLLVENGGWVSKKYFNSGLLYKIYSPKFAALLINIILHNNQKHVVFTFFKQRAGVNLIKSILSMCGISSEIFSGDLDDKQRTIVLNEFNSPKNRYGEKIRVLLVTEAGAEGINILEARHMHILESSPRATKIKQAIGRVARYKSHIALPPQERSVKIWRYWSVGSKNPITISIKDKDKYITDKKCIDEILYDNGVKTLREIDYFLDILKSVSVLEKTN
jgi:superfamily II DNA or RNA helicase